MPWALFCFFFWHFTAYRAFAGSRNGDDFQARLDYVAFLRRDFVALRMTVLNVRSTLICSGVILSALHFGFLGISTTGLQGVNAISVLLCCFC